MLLNTREHEHLHWSGKFRPSLTGQGVYPRPVQNPLPIWLGVGGTPRWFARAGALGLPLMVAIIGGDVPGMWRHALLRRLAQPSRDEACSLDQQSGDRVGRAR